MAHSFYLVLFIEKGWSALISHPVPLPLTPRM
uniref:Uncharacterized protein n=1 Tax=Anguilla anguilla TaxID=7936 RepID=A0A0E9R7M1_ANGAN